MSFARITVIIIAMDNVKKYVHHKKSDGKVYVYEVLENYWDKDKKQARNKQRCIGQLDPVTGEVIPSKRLGGHAKPAMDPEIKAKTSITGPSLILSKVSRECGLTKVLKQVFPEYWAEILSLAWYILSTGSALSHAEIWCQNHDVPSKRVLSSQRISELLDTLSEGDRQMFFSIWGQSIIAKDYLCYDITSVSSYAEYNEYVRYGYNRDKEDLPQINIGMVYGQQSMLPVAYRQLPGSINDVATLIHLLDMFAKLDFPKLHLIMDKGFYSESNIDALAEGGHNFTIGVSAYLKWVRDIIDEDRHLIDGPSGYHEHDGEVVYAHTRLLSWGETKRRAYIHIYYDAEKVAKDRVQFDQNLYKWKHELEEDRRVAANTSYYERYFICKTTPKRGLQVSFNVENILAARKEYVGFFAILTTKFKDPLQALDVYREKDVVEKCFDDLKNDLDSKRIRVHKSGRMQSRLFIQFIALILMSSIRTTMKASHQNKRYTVKSLIWEMESLTTIRYSGKYKNKQSEVTKAQRNILEAFGIEVGG